MPFAVLITPLLFFMGASIGSFLNVVVLRFVNGVSIGSSRSACPSCHRMLTWYELIPVLSYLALKGRCRTCRQAISLQYPLVEIVCGIVLLQFLSYTGDIALTAVRFTIFCLLLILFLIDLYTFLLPDYYVVLLSVVVAVWLALVQPLPGQSIFWGAIVGTAFLLSLWLATHGRGIGFGDVKLMIPLGLFLGGKGIVTLLFIAFTLGGLVGASLLIARKANRKTAIPFGPFLTGAAMLLMMYPEGVDLFWKLLTGGFSL